MSYRIGQIRKSNETSYLTDIEFIETELHTRGYTDKDFTDYAIQLKNNNGFNANNTYYLRFTVKRINHEDLRFQNQAPYKDKNMNDPREMNIRLTLFQHNEGTYQLGEYQTIQTNVEIEPYIQGRNTEYASYEIIFTPNNTYKYLGFILSRTTYDYTHDPRDDFQKTVDLGDKGDLCIVNNILSKIPVDKIGIQSRPGSLVCINKEAFRIGRSGTLQVNNGVKIRFFGIVGPNGSDNKNIDKFILDYAWDE